MKEETEGGMVITTMHTIISKASNKVAKPLFHTYIPGKSNWEEIPSLPGKPKSEGRTR